MNNLKKCQRSNCSLGTVSNAHTLRIDQNFLPRVILYNSNFRLT